jgi:hypothetical protein
MLRFGLLAIGVGQLADEVSQVSTLLPGFSEVRPD